MSPRLAFAVLALAAACNKAQPCPSPLEECSGQCVDVQSDRRHCGACGQACAAGESCLGAACDGTPTTACASRGGGAFVTLGHCGQAVKLWIANPDFITAAQGAVGAPTTPGVPVLTVQSGTDCDGQWSWHVNQAAALFQPAPPSPACAVCPQTIEGDLAQYILSPGTWCPTSATILAVDVR